MSRYVDAENAISVLEILADKCADDKAFEQAISVLKDVPTADVVERKVGKWVEEVGMLMCSECGDAWGTEQFDEVMSFNYCPNCGAEMRGE